MYVYNKAILALIALVVWVIAPTYLSFKLEDWLAGNGNVVRIIAQAMIFAAITGFWLFVAFRTKKSSALRVENSRGRPADLNEAFRIGDALKVIGVTREDNLVVFKSHFKTKLVRVPKSTKVTVGKHYILHKDCELRDLMEGGSAGVEPLENQATA